MIQDYDFGRIKINNTTYMHDVIIKKDKVIKWWRRSGHEVVIEDIENILDENIEVIVFGSGAAGIMKVSKEVIDYLNKKNITTVVVPTHQAVNKYNDLSAKKGEEKVVAALHLTC